MKVYIFGNINVGKSTFINSLFGVNKAKTSLNAETTTFTEYNYSNDIIFVDTPGFDHKGVYDDSFEIIRKIKHSDSVIFLFDKNCLESVYYYNFMKKMHNKLFNKEFNLSPNVIFILNKIDEINNNQDLKIVLNNLKKKLEYIFTKKNDKDEYAKNINNNINILTYSSKVVYGLKNIHSQNKNINDWLINKIYDKSIQVEEEKVKIPKEILNVPRSMTEHDSIKFLSSQYKKIIDTCDLFYKKLANLLGIHIINEIKTKNYKIIKILSLLLRNNIFSVESEFNTTIHGVIINKSKLINKYKKIASKFERFEDYKSLSDYSKKYIDIFVEKYCGFDKEFLKKQVRTKINIWDRLFIAYMRFNLVSKIFSINISPPKMDNLMSELDYDNILPLKSDLIKFNIDNLVQMFGFFNDFNITAINKKVLIDSIKFYINENIEVFIKNNLKWNVIRTSDHFKSIKIIFINLKNNDYADGVIKMIDTRIKKELDVEKPNTEILNMYLNIRRLVPNHLSYNTNKIIEYLTTFIGVDIDSFLQDNYHIVMKFLDDSLLVRNQETKKIIFKILKKYNEYIQVMINYFKEIINIKNNNIDHQFEKISLLDLTQLGSIYGLLQAVGFETLSASGMALLGIGSASSAFIIGKNLGYLILYIKEKINLVDIKKNLDKYKKIQNKISKFG